MVNISKRMTREELDKIIENHHHWLNRDIDGWEKMRADLRYADLSYMDLRYVNLTNMNLSNAFLRGSDLSWANLSYADLNGSDLSYANFHGSDLSWANLSYVNLQYAILRGAKNVPFIPMACPDSGEFIGWKKASSGRIVKLLIPSDAKRLSATGRKCRASEAIVL